MTWSDPFVAVQGQLMTAAFWNAQVKDNMLETSAAAAVAAGDLIYADGVNSMGSRLAIGAAGAILVSTGSAPVWRESAGLIGDTTYTAAGAFPLTFTDLNSALWSSGTTVAVTLTTGSMALVWFGNRHSQHPTLGSNVQLSYRVSGASTIAASTSFGTLAESDPAGTFSQSGRAHLVSSLTPGSNTFTLQGMVSSGAAATIGSPWIVVQAL